MNIVLVAPSGGFASALARIPVGPDDRVVLVTRDAPDADDGDILVLKPAAASLTAAGQRMLGRSVLGRNLLRISPLDAGRRFWAAARKDLRFHQAARAADVLVALERDAILTAWSATHAYAAASADGVYGIAPAQAAVTRRRA